jgi:hypothetical protein
VLVLIIILFCSILNLQGCKFYDKNKIKLLYTTKKEEFLPIKKIEDLIKANKLFS